MTGLRCAVLGAGGFIGLNLARALLRQGAEVVGIGRSPPAGLMLDGLRWIVAEFGDHGAIARAVAGADVVYHLLGGSVPAQSNADPAGDMLGSLLPSIRLLDACRGGLVGRLVFASSGGTVYGPDAPSPTPEDAATDPITAYGVNKLTVEKYIGLYRHLHGVDAVSLRIANPYGPFQHERRPQGIVGTALARALRGETVEVWGDGGIVRDYVYVGDVVDAMLAAARYRGRHAVFNVGSGQGRSVLQVVTDIHALTGRPAGSIVFRPGRRADVDVSILDSSRLTRETGWTPQVSWNDGLVRTIEWLVDRRPPAAPPSFVTASPSRPPMPARRRWN